ncbi:MAG: hypothetical protein E7045_02925 [Lentisphaerae bacterium]|nr:hypothetical protein [Lentisphaerota bacterium]
MAEILINCPFCGAALQAQDNWEGLELECPSCKQPFIAGQQVQPQIIEQVRAKMQAEANAKAQKEAMQRAKAEEMERAKIQAEAHARAQMQQQMFAKAGMQNLGNNTNRHNGSWKILFWLFVIAALTCFSMGTYSTVKASKAYASSYAAKPSSNYEGSVTIGESGYACAKNTITLVENTAATHRMIQKNAIASIFFIWGGVSLFGALLTVLYAKRYSEE